MTYRPNLQVILVHFVPFIVLRNLPVQPQAPLTSVFPAEKESLTKQTPVFFGTPGFSFYIMLQKKVPLWRKEKGNFCTNITLVEIVDLDLLLLFTLHSRYCSVADGSSSDGYKALG